MCYEARKLDLRIFVNWAPHPDPEWTPQPGLTLLKTSFIITPYYITIMPVIERKPLQHH